MANDGNADEKKPIEHEKEIEEAISSENSSLNELAQHAGISVAGGSNVATYDRSTPPSAPTEAEWSSVEIPTNGETPITDSEASSLLTENPFPNILPHLEPFFQRLEFERHRMLEQPDTSDEALRQHWYNVTAERDHIFRIMFCQDSRFDVADDLDKLEKISNTVLREAICPDAIMGYLRTQIRKLLRLISLAKVHLRSENCHYPSISNYPSVSPELITNSSDPSDLHIPLEDRSWAARPIAVSSQHSSYSRLMSSQHSSFSRGSDSQHSSLSQAAASSSSGPSGPSASTGAISKRPPQLLQNLYPTIEEVSFTSSLPDSKHESHEVTLSPRNPLPSSQVTGYPHTSHLKLLPEPQIKPCVPVNSSYELILSSLGDFDKVCSGSSDSGQLSYEFADALHLKLREITEADGTAPLQHQGLLGVQDMAAERSQENAEEKKSPVRFYIGSDTSSSSGLSGDLETDEQLERRLLEMAGTQAQQRREDSESSGDFYDFNKLAGNQRPS